MSGELEKVATAIRDNLKVRTSSMTEHDIAKVAIEAISDGHFLDGTDVEGFRVCRHPDHNISGNYRYCWQAILAEEIS